MGLPAKNSQQLGEVLDFPAKNASPEALLNEARKAWMSKLNAERTISRLKKYSGMNRSMKQDHSDAYSRMTSAEQTLNRILNTNSRIHNTN